MQTQLELQEEIIEKTGINVCTCGSCGSVLLHKWIENIDFECPDCGFTSEPCDFPDLNY